MTSIAPVLNRKSTPEITRVNARRWPARLGWGIVLLSIIGGAYVAGRATVATPDLPAAEAIHPVTPATTRTLGRSVELPLTVEWDRFGLPSPATGTVTRTAIVDSSADSTSFEIDEGDTVVEVDLRPVVAIVGDTPLTRPLANGSRGADVETLQAFLVRNELLAADDANGVFGSSTSRAVRAWQKDNQQTVTGVVDVGQFMAFAELPTMASYADGVGVGRPIVLGADLIDVIDPLPRLAAPLEESQRVLLGDLPVEIQLGETGLPLDGVRYELDAEGETKLIIDAKPVASCGVACEGALTPGIDALLNGTIVVVPATEGVTVPITSIVTNPSGQTSVVLESGERRSVTVVLQDGSQVIVEGLELGEPVRVFGVGA